MNVGAIDIAGLDGDGVRILPEDLQTLESRVSGRVLRPAEDGWDDAVLVWNGMAAKVPSLVVQPTSAHDVAAAVAFARERRLLVSVKGGGHNIAGAAIAERGLTLDMSHMRELAVDPDAKLAQVGPGCLLKEVDQATQDYGLATVLGFVSETGVAGLTLGGGFGYLTRRFGWAVDSLEQVEIVTADGDIHTANREQDPDLFWAVRGGGGNFGVVTRFTFRLHEVGPIVTGGLVIWSAERVDDVLGAYRELTESAPRELTIAAVVRQAPPAPFVPEEWHGKPIAGMLVCHTGHHPEADLAPIRALGDPIVDLVTERPYVLQQSIINAMEPKRLHRYWKAEYLAGVSSEFLKAFRDSALDVTSPLSQSLIFHLGGALNEREDDDGAVGNRDAAYIAGFNGTWPPGANSEPHVAWVRRAWENIRPFSTGGNYVNFQVAEDDIERTMAAYGDNYERLQQVKAKYDPGNLFRVNRNIPPAI